jgi:phenylpropionate dioxygenase-like ring-hydroxylating dioxygenase large terminal subunit
MTETPPPVAARWWQPVCAEADLGDAPLALRALGVDLVLWRHGDAVAAFDDRCPHRGARLSLGRVVGDALQCAYHHPQPPALGEVPSRRVVCGPYVVETSAPRVVENFLDTSHFAFVHAGWLGDAGHPEVPDHRVAATADGRPLVDDYLAWQPRAAAAATAGAWVRYRYEVLGPFAALLVKQPQAIDGGPDAVDPGVAALRDAYAAFACALDEERTRVWFLQYTGDATTPDAALQQFQDTIFGQDRPVLESQRPRRLPLSGGELHSAADRLSAAYRRWLLAQRIDFGVC